MVWGKKKPAKAEAKEETSDGAVADAAVVDAGADANGQQQEQPSPSSSSPAHYRIPDEPGYFPAGSDDAGAIGIEIEKATLYPRGPTLYRIHPPSTETKDDGDNGDKSGKDDDKGDDPLASGTLTLRDPDAGTADDVVLVGRCDETLFYVMGDDAVTKVSATEFLLMLPEDCILMDLTGCADEEILKVEGLFAARTKFHDETASTADSTKEYPDELPDDAVSKALFRASVKVAQLTVSMGEMGASKIEAYGEKKKESVTETKDVKVGKTSIAIAKGTRAAAEKTHEVAETISGKISDVLGGKVGRAAAMKEGEGSTKKKARSLLMASTIAYGEVGRGASEGYELMVQSAQQQATSFVAKKYGMEAAELVRHTAGAAANFGRAALTARRVVNVKKVVKSAGKQMVKETIKNSL